MQVDRTGQNRTVVPVLVEKDNSWQDQILDLCIDSIVSGTIPRPKVRSQHFVNESHVLILSQSIMKVVNQSTCSKFMTISK